MSETSAARTIPTVREATEFEPMVYQFDGAGGVIALPFDGGPVPEVKKGFVLIAGSLSSPAFRSWLQQHLDPQGAEGLTASDQHARCTVADDRALVVLRIVRTRTDPDDLRKQSMALWLEKNRVVIASKLSIAELVSIAQWEKSHHAPVSPADLIARMGTRAADRVEPLVEHLGDVLDSIEEEMITGHNLESRQKLTRLRRSLINIRRLLWPQRDVLNTLEIEDLSWLSPRDRSRLKEASARTARLGDELQVLAERAALVHEQVLDTRAEQMNRNMLVLAAATVVFMPLTVISGLLGMNVEGIPFHDSPLAFWVVTTGLAMLGVGIYLFMRTRKWM